MVKVSDLPDRGVILHETTFFDDNTSVELRPPGGLLHSINDRPTLGSQVDKRYAHLRQVLGLTHFQL